MTSPLAFAALGIWSYAGFLAEPSKIPRDDWPPTPVAIGRKEEPGATPALPAPTPPTSAPAPAVVRKEEPPAAPAAPGPGPRPTPAAPAVPTTYRLLDARGQAWEHSDPAFLQVFIRDRNLSMTRPYAPAPPCVGGRCR